MSKFENEMYDKGYDDGFSDATGYYIYEKAKVILLLFFMAIIFVIMAVCAYKYGAAHPETTNEHLVDMQTVTDFEAREEGLYLYLTDGTGYFWEREVVEK